MTEALPGTRIFISYRRADTEKAATKIYAALVDNFGKRYVFQDVASILPGIPWDEAIDEAVGSCHVFLVVIGPEWLAVTDDAGNTRLADDEDRHRREIEVALDRRIPVLPVLIDKAAMPRPEQLPGEKLKRLQKIQAQRINLNAFTADIDDLIAVIEQAATIRSHARPPEPEEEPPPTADEAKRASALQLAAAGEFRSALEVAHSIEDPVLRADVLLSVASAQVDAGAHRDEPESAPPTPTVIRDAERETVVPAVDLAQGQAAAAPAELVTSAFGAAVEIVGSSGTVTGHNAGAAKEPNEPDHAGNSGGSSVWYRWSAPADGTATIDTFGSSFDTLLAVYRGDNLAELELVAANDDADGRQSRVTFHVTAADEYVLAVDGYGGETGEIVLNWTLQLPPANVSFAEAQELVGARGTVHGDSTGASKEQGEPDHAGGAGGASVWYRWTAPEAGIGIIDTFGSSFDTLLGVYKGSSLTELAVIASNDDAGGTTQSRVAFHTSSGEEYRIAVDGYSGATGPIVLSWTIAERFTLTTCLELAGLRYADVGNGAVTIRVPGSRVDEVVVDAIESAEGVAFFSVDIPAYSGFGAKGAYRALLEASLKADYVKAMSLTEGGLALAAEIPASALSPAVCQGLVWGLAALADVRGPSDLKDTNAWNERLNECRRMQERYIRIDQDVARADVHALLQAGGLASIAGTYFLDLGLERTPVRLHLSERVISLMVDLQGVRPRNDKRKLEHLLDLNRRVDIAKAGLAANGDVALLFEVPAVVPDLLERATAQLSHLYVGVRAGI